MFKQITIMFLFSIVILGSSVFAADYYIIADGATVKINEHSQCHSIYNDAGSNFFVPTKTAAEWSSCWSSGCNSVSSITVTACPKKWAFAGSYNTYTSPSILNAGTCTTVGATGGDSYTLGKGGGIADQICGYHDGVYTNTNTQGYSSGAPACPFTPVIFIPEARYGCDGIGSTCEWLNGGGTYYIFTCTTT